MKKYFILLLFLGVIVACNQTKQDAASEKDERFAQVYEIIEKSDSLVLALQEKVKTLAKEDELGALKINNTIQMIKDNVREVKTKMAALSEGKIAEADTKNHIIDILSQGDYIQSLCVGGKAVLSGNSQAIGTWVEEPDSTVKHDGFIGQ